MSAHSLLNSVFSCSSSPAPGASPSFPPKSLSKRRLRQTRSLDPAVIGRGEEAADGSLRAPRARAVAAAGSPSAECLAAFSSRALLRPAAPPTPPPPLSTPSTPLDKSPSGSFHFDYESPRGKRHTAWELPFLARAPSASALGSVPGGGGGANSIFFSPRKWLQQRKGQQLPSSHASAYVVWKSEH
ncbi:Hypothetical predicted protein [Podarcis lilfordi]|uniref:Uncharacterized protein n=1 Tax=Podarcis lilfordi TaxID=74358 RepID=A0AA35K7B7_9SAUR|nr:Hypothetical predicted protein [Podarcis lilfordi]